MQDSKLNIIYIKEIMAIRKDKLKNKAIVTKSLLKDPTQSESQLKESTWLWAWTVHRHKNEVEKNGVESDIMDRILGMDDEIMDLVNKISLKDIQDKYESWEKLSLQDIKLLWDLANNSTKRKAIFWDGNDKNKSRDITIQI